MGRGVCFVLFIFITVGCANLGAPIRSYRHFHQPLEQALTASIGSTLVRMNRVGDLPNAFGGRDIYGGKVDRGYVEIRLLDISDRSALDLEVRDIVRQSTETTMDRYGNWGAVQVSQNVNINPLEQESVKVKIDGIKEREFVIDGIKIGFLEIGNSSVTYKISDLRPVH